MINFHEDVLCKELNKLETYLASNKFNYIRVDQSPYGMSEPWHQLVIYDDNGERLWDAVINDITYGHEVGNLELYGDIADEGWQGNLTADDIIAIIEGRYRGEGHKVMVDSIHEDPKIIKLAKLILLLVDKDTDNDTKIGCIKFDIKNELITQDEALQLLTWLPDLQDFL